MQESVKRILKKIVPLKIVELRRKYLFAKWKKTSRFAAYNTAKEAFTNVYETNYWMGGTVGESVSGAGSTLAETKKVIQVINSLIKELNIKTFLDLPCGDFNWMQHVNLSGVQYIGADIVDPLIAKNAKKYTSDNIQFQVLNLIEDPLPKCDMLLTRDCVMHLSFSDIYKSMKNIKASGCKYLLITTSPEHSINFESVTGGDCRNLNLEKKPFNFPPPMRIFNEETPFSSDIDDEQKDKSLGLWKIEDIKIPSTVYK